MDCHVSNANLYFETTSAAIAIAILDLIARGEGNLSPETTRTHRNNLDKHRH
jgi:hypothetical protein